MKIKALLFDLDGTLCDTLPQLNEGMNRTLAHFGLPPIGREGVLSGINDGPRRFVERVFPAGTDEATIDRATAQYIRDYEDVFMGTKEAFPGMAETLRTLKANGCKLAVLTNKASLAATLLVRQIFGDGLFDEVHGVADKPLKPSPEAALAILKRFGALPEESCMVGDSHIDMQTGVNAGMHPIGVSYGYKPREVLIENGAEFIADSAPALLDIVKAIESA